MYFNRDMKFFNRIFCIVCAVVGLSSCVEYDGLSFEEAESIALQSWIQINHPELMDNYQVNGDYYVELLDEGVADSLPVRNAASWVWFEVTCRDLAGNVVLTRNSDLARMQSSYTDHTHYVPFYIYCGEENTSTLPEGIYLSLRNKLKIGDLDYTARYGTKMRLYLPSSIGTKSSGMQGDGGYQGQYSLDANRPMIVDIQVWGHVTNPLAYEDQWVFHFAEANGGVAPAPETEEEAKEGALRRRSYMRETRAEGEQEADTVYDEKWHLAVDSIAGLYINYLYSPAKSLNYDCLRQDTLIYKGQTEYTKGKLYGDNGFAEINRKVDEALIERFGKGLHPADAEPMDSTSTAKIWYVARLLDGFVIDSNISEVKKIVYKNDYDPIYDTSDALSFVTGDDLEGSNSYVDAWLYAVPQLKLGAWNAILTVSSNAYGATGVAGSSSTSSSTSYSNYYDYYNYYNSYYGNSYYNNYYNNYYGGYGGMYGGMGGMYGGMGGMYGGYGDYYNNYYNSYYYNNYYNNSYTTGETETTTTVTTEVLPYTPLIWQVFVEEAK